MNWKKLIKISFFTLPLAIIIFIFFNAVQSKIVGGLGTSLGFPISYYVDIWETPGIELNSPIIILVDILINYLIITSIAYVIAITKKKV